MSFKIGDEVVCIIQYKSLTDQGADTPVKNETYIVTSTISDYGCSCVMLKNMNCLGRGYEASNFKKLSKVSLQQELAEKATKQVEERIDVPLKEEELV